MPDTGHVDIGTRERIGRAVRRHNAIRREVADEFERRGIKATAAEVRAETLHRHEFEKRHQRTYRSFIDEAMKPSPKPKRRQRD